MDAHYVRFARSLALVSAAVVGSACTSTPAPIQMGGGNCSHAGQACVIGSPAIDTCCVCTAPSTEAGPPPDGGAGTWVSPCIGPLPPPELAA